MKAPVKLALWQDSLTLRWTAAVWGKSSNIIKNGKRPQWKTPEQATRELRDWIGNIEIVKIYPVPEQEAK